MSTILICFGSALLLFGGGFFIYKRMYLDRRNLFEDMDGVEFENYCAGFLTALGYENVELTSISHDYGVDIFAEKEGISYAFQCKCYTAPVGIKAIQEVYSGRDYYSRMVGVVITNCEFTRPAREFAKKLNVLLWDGDEIARLRREAGCE